MTTIVSESHGSVDRGAARRTGPSRFVRRITFFAAVVTSLMTLTVIDGQPAGAVSAPIALTTSVNLRPGPSTTSGNPLTVMPSGTSPNFLCWTQGQNINGVDVWFQVTYAGLTGYYASYYDNSSYTTDSQITSKYGIPQCGAVPPPPATTNGQKAIAWAQTKLGQTAWDGLCLNFVYQAYLYGAGVDITGGLPYAAAHNTAYTYWTVVPNHHTDTNPPAGALVFWRAASSPTGAGHVGLSLGGGTIISSYDGRTYGIHKFNISSYQQNLYLGWVLNW